MPYPPRKGDVPIQNITETAYRLLIDDPTIEIYIKWTCPSCGERVMSDDKLQIIMHQGRKVVRIAPAYLHTEKDDGTPCMVSVQHDKYLFGFALVAKL